MPKILFAIKCTGFLILFSLILSTGYVFSDDLEDAALLQGIALSNQGNYDEAIAQYNKVIENNPRNAAAFNNRATAYGLQGNFVAAISDYTTAIEIEPSFSVAYYSRGTAFGVTGDMERALADFDKAIELNPKYGQAYADRAKLFFIKKEFDKSLADVVKAKALGVAVDPNVVSALQGIATKTISN